MEYWSSGFEGEGIGEAEKRRESAKMRKGEVVI